MSGPHLVRSLRSCSASVMGHREMADIHLPSPGSLNWQLTMSRSSLIDLIQNLPLILTDAHVEHLMSLHGFRFFFRINQLRTHCNS